MTPGKMRRTDAVGDAAYEWLDDSLNAGMSTTDASRILRETWIPRLIAAILADDADADDGPG